MPVAVLAGGLATRLGALTADLPKLLIDVGGRPFAEYQLDLLQQSGITKVVYCLGHLGDRVVEALGDGRQRGMTFEYVHDGPTLMGTGGALRRALPKLGRTFFVLYGDSYLDCDYRRIASSFEASGQLGLMTVYRNDDRFDRSNVEFRGDRIIRYDKTHRDAGMRHIDYGLGILSREAFDPWHDETEPLDLAAIYQALIARSQLAGYEVASRFYEIGSVAGLTETRALLEQHPPTTS